MFNAVASFVGNNAASRATIPPNYSAQNTGRLVTLEEFGDELDPKRHKQYWDQTYDKLPFVETVYPFAAAQNAVGGQVNQVWQFQTGAYAPINMTTQQVNISFQAYQIVAGTQEAMTMGKFWSFYEYYFHEGMQGNGNPYSGWPTVGTTNTDKKSYLWNCPQTGLFPLLTTYEVKTGIQPISVSYMTQDRNLLFKAGAFILRKIEHNYELIVPWLELWTMNENVSIATVDPSIGWGSYTQIASELYLYEYFDPGTPPPPWVLRFPTCIADKIEKKFPFAWLKARSAFISSLLNTFLTGSGGGLKWDTSNGNPLPTVGIDLAFPVSLFQPLFEQPAHVLAVNDQWRFDVKWNTKQTVRLAWGTQFIITAIANPIQTFSAIVNNILQPTLQLQQELASKYSQESQIFNYYAWKQSQEYIIKAGQTTFDFQLIAGDAIPDYIIVTICNPTAINSSLRSFDYQYNNINTNPNIHWQDHCSFDDNQIPIRFSNLVITAWQVKTVVYSDEGYMWRPDSNIKSIDYAYDYQKRLFWNSLVDIQDKGDFIHQYGYQTAYVIPTDPGYYQKEDGDLFKHTDRGISELKLSGTITRAPLYMQNPASSPFAPLPYDCTLRCYLAYNTTMEVTPSKTINTMVPPSFPLLNNFSRVSNLNPNSATPVGGIQTN